MGELSNIIDVLFAKKDIDMKLLNYIKSLNGEEKKHYVFKTFYDNKDERLINSMENIILGSNFSYTYTGHKLIDMIVKGKLFYEYKSKMSFNRKNYCGVMGYYYSLLSKMFKLADELTFNNSTELSIFFSYLLWNGYLSKNKFYNFDTYNRKNIYGLFFADIADGKGVCLNNSDFLKDFLNYCGYSSAVLTNFYGSNIEIESILKVKRKFAHERVDKEKCLFDNFKKKKSNHVFNFIEDSGKYYIYDSTNFLLANIINAYCAEVVNGFGKFKLFPYYSYSFCSSTEEEQNDR